MSEDRKLETDRMDAVQSSVNLAARKHFAGVYVRQKYLRLGFVSDVEIDDERIVKTEQLGGGKVQNVVILRSPDHIDEQLLKWLERSYPSAFGEETLTDEEPACG